MGARRQFESLDGGRQVRVWVGLDALGVDPAYDLNENRTNAAEPV